MADAVALTLNSLGGSKASETSKQCLGSWEGMLD